MTAIERMFILLENQGKSIQSLCNYLNISSSVMANWKKRSEYPPTKYLITICEFLGVSTDFILSGKNSETDLTSNEKEFLSIIKKLSSERDQVKLIGVADNYAKTLSSYITNAQNNKEEGSDAQQRTGKVG